MQQSQSQSQSQSPTKIQKLNAGCFRCHKTGHWYKDCPETAANRSPISPSSSTPPPSTTTNTTDPQFPSIHCRCGVGLCHIVVSGSQNNPGRKYYRCPASSYKSCGYFKWCDQLRSEENQESFPVCGCKAGTCTLMIEKNGPGAGRRYFGCPVKKGEGACNFRQWLDNPPQPASTISENITVKHNSLLDEVELTNEGAMQIDALETSAHEIPLEEVHVQTEPAHQLSLEEVQMEAHELPVEEVQAQKEAHELPFEEVQVQVEEDKGDKGSDGARETSALSTEINPPSFTNIVCEKTSDSEMTNENRVIVQKRMDDSATEDVHTSLTAVVGTAGIPVSKGSLPNFDDPVIMPKENASIPSLILQKDPPAEKSSPYSNEGSIMKGTVLAAFEKLARSLENDLITLLESTSPQYHEIMLKEADSTFAALDRLQVDYELFKLRVTEYITQAASVAQIEQTISNDASSRALLKRYKIEKSRFDEISSAYHEARAAFMASDERVSLLRENASCLRDMLIELETEVSCCEAEKAVCRDRLVQITNSMSESKNSLQAASRAAAEALKVSEKREIERSAAKAAFEKARAHLRM